jgi:hypothetical protein
VRLYLGLNREAFQLRSRPLDAAIGGLRRPRNPGLPNQLRDTAQAWAVIEPVLPHHVGPRKIRGASWLSVTRVLRETGDG